MKTWLMALTVAALAVATVAPDAQAKRLGAGKSTGMQRDMPARTAPDAPAGKPATPAQSSPQQAGQGAAAAAPGAAAAAAPKRSWMGPLAGLAAGLGIAALMSHLGMGEAMGNMLMIALLAVAAFFVIRLLMRRFGPQQPATATPFSAAGGNPGGATQVAWPSQASGAATAPAALAPEAELPAASEPLPQAKPAAAKAFVPASFDHESFERAAKLIFIRLQAANDSGDLDDLRSFTTPEMFAEVRLAIQERGAAKQHTDVQRVEVQVLDVAQEAERQVVSVRFHGDVVEEAGAAPTAFNEVWHLVKPQDDSRSWAVAGIEQLN
jgi:predicted lipid-binding transport protein (Tim44 family)